MFNQIKHNYKNIDIFNSIYDTNINNNNTTNSDIHNLLDAKLTYRNQLLRNQSNQNIEGFKAPKMKAPKIQAPKIINKIEHVAEQVKPAEIAKVAEQVKPAEIAKQVKPAEIAKQVKKVESKAVKATTSTAVNVAKKTAKTTKTAVKSVKSVKIPNPHLKPIPHKKITHKKAPKKKAHHDKHHIINKINNISNDMSWIKQYIYQLIFIFMSIIFSGNFYYFLVTHSWSTEPFNIPIEIINTYCQPILRLLDSIITNGFQSSFVNMYKNVLFKYSQISFLFFFFMFMGLLFMYGEQILNINPFKMNSAHFSIHLLLAWVWTSTFFELTFTNLSNWFMTPVFTLITKICVIIFAHVTAAYSQIILLSYLFIILSGILLFYHNSSNFVDICTNLYNTFMNINHKKTEDSVSDDDDDDNTFLDYFQKNIISKFFSFIIPITFMLFFIIKGFDGLSQLKITNVRLYFIFFEVISLIICLYFIIIQIIDSMNKFKPLGLMQLFFPITDTILTNNDLIFDENKNKLFTTASSAITAPTITQSPQSNNINPIISTQPPQTNNINPIISTQ